MPMLRRADRRPPVATGSGRRPLMVPGLALQAVGALLVREGASPADALRRAHRRRSSLAGLGMALVFAPTANAVLSLGPPPTRPARPRARPTRSARSAGSWAWPCWPGSSRPTAATPRPRPSPTACARAADRRGGAARGRGRRAAGAVTRAGRGAAGGGSGRGLTDARGGRGRGRVPLYRGGVA